ncbi:MAG: hypothetical protein GY725_08025 [bacterium]|nr:hypothetical protein [bacterium]
MNPVSKMESNAESPGRPGSFELDGLIDELAEEATREGALARLRAIGPAARERVVAGLLDGRWQVRLACLSWLGASGSPEDVREAVPLLCDPRSRVRVSAVYVVGRRREGRGDPLLSAEVLLMERVCQDESIKVRREAARMLAFERAHPQLEGFFQKILDEECDPKLHQAAGIGLWFCRHSPGSSLAEDR